MSITRSLVSNILRNTRSAFRSSGLLRTTTCSSILVKNYNRGYSSLIHNNNTSILPQRGFASVSDAELSGILNKELKYELEVKEDQPDFLTEFLANKTFTINDRQGSNEVTLTREFGNERINITFSIDDISNVEPIEESEEMSFPVSAVITVTKNNNNVGAISFQTIVDNGSFQVTAVTYNDDSNLAITDTAEADYKRRGTYMGPIFDELDDTLSDAFYQYLDNRGINSQLAEFIPAYVEWKEQQEYIHWLNKVKIFVDQN